MTDEEEFFAWLDGELDRADADRVAARVAGDPALTAMAEQHRALGAGLKTAFDPAMKESKPPQFGGEVVDLGAVRARRSSFGVPQWAAMAATLAIGIVAGQFVGPRSGSPIETRGGAMIASASLDRALDTQLASANGTGPVRAGLTFRAQDGAICRSFVNDGASGLACRDGGDWKVEGLFAAPSNQSADYRMAAGDNPQLAGLIDARIAGEPFDAAAERAVRQRGWR